MALVILSQRPGLGQRDRSLKTKESFKRLEIKKV
jgi:hypothetical protein